MGIFLNSGNKYKILSSSVASDNYVDWFLPNCNDRHVLSGMPVVLSSSELSNCLAIKFSNLAWQGFSSRGKETKQNKTKQKKPIDFLKRKNT